MLGRGYLAGLDMREQRRAHTFSQALNDKRASEARAQEEAEGLARAERKKREAQRKKERDALTQALAAEEKKVEATALGKKLLHWTEKPLQEMNARDWRIMKVRDAAQKMNLNVTWSRRWRRRDATPPRRRRRGRQSLRVVS